MDWKNDRRVQFAIGLAIVFVGLRWLFTGNLFFAAVDMSAEPANGQTRAGVTINAVLPVLIDVFVGSLIAVGAWMINLSELIVGKLKGSLSPPQAEPTAAVASMPSAEDRMRSLVIDLGRAAWENDLEKLEALRWQIRKPQAIAELSAAYDANDMETAASRKAELDKMLGLNPKSVKKGGQ